MWLLKRKLTYASRREIKDGRQSGCCALTLESFSQIGPFHWGSDDIRIAGEVCDTPVILLWGRGTGIFKISDNIGAFYIAISIDSGGDFKNCTSCHLSGLLALPVPLNGVYLGSTFHRTGALGGGSAGNFYWLTETENPERPRVGSFTQKSWRTPMF